MILCLQVSSQEFEKLRLLTYHHGEHILAFRKKMNFQSKLFLKAFMYMKVGLTVQILCVMSLMKVTEFKQLEQVRFFLLLFCDTY